MFQNYTACLSHVSMQYEKVNNTQGGHFRSKSNPPSLSHREMLAVIWALLVAWPRIGHLWWMCGHKPGSYWVQIMLSPYHQLSSVATIAGNVGPQWRSCGHPSTQPTQPLDLKGGSLWLLKYNQRTLPSHKHLKHIWMYSADKLFQLILSLYYVCCYVALSHIHTSYLSFFLHWQNFWRIIFTPKKPVNYDKIHSKLAIFCVITAKYTVNCQFFALLRQNTQ